MRFGVVGTAHWASEIHLPGLLSTAGAEVAGVWGRSPAKVAELASRHGVASFASFEAMLRAVDAVTIAVPPSVQTGLAVRAAQAGKHLILEKPIAADLPGARALAEAVKAAGVASLVFFTRRFQPEIAAAIEAARGEGWTRAEIRVHSSVMVTASPYAGSAWRQERGAALWDIGPHVLSVLLPLLGDVTAATLAPAPDGVVRLRTVHACGGTAEISLSLHSPADQVSNWYRFQSPAKDVVLPDPSFSRADTFSVAARRLMEMVRAGRKTDPCDVQLGERVVAILAEADPAGAPATPPTG